MPTDSTSKLSKTQQLTVVVRIRPLFDHEQKKGASKIARKADNQMVLLSDPTAGDPVDILRAKRAQERSYVFDLAFDDDSTQEEVYEKTTKTLVQNVVQGYNGTVFAYGATGSGKTYTMVGQDESPGIMVRALKDLFKEVDADQNKLFQVSMSYLEIYNENIRDLLNPSPLQLELREDAKGNHRVAGLSEVEISSSEEVMSLLTRGNRRRTQESTGANSTSSRSHALLIVRVRRRSPAHSEQQSLRTGTLYMVDLAGSERASQTQNTGKRLVEGAHINKSLLALGNCINALAERSPRYVNFRDSKLTRLLKEPLSGNCRTVMVSHVSPAHFHFEETRNTLAYADRAKSITTKLRSNTSEVTHHVAQYKSIIAELRSEIQALHARIETSHSPPCDNKGEEKRLTDEQMKKLKQQLIESFNAQMEVRRRMMDIDNAVLSYSIEYDKLGMIISEWETEKALDHKDEGRILANNGNQEKEEMPEHVMQAWEDMQFAKEQHQRYSEKRTASESEYRRCKERTLAVTESLAHSRASSREQKELLHLLTRVYELEIEKLELQSSQLVREHELRCRDLMLLRYDRQRQLCDQIITRQRMLLDAMATGGEVENANAKRELTDLYRIYQPEIQELGGGRRSDLSPGSPYYRPGSSGLRPLGSSGSMLELHQLQSNRDSTRRTPLPPIAHGEKGSGEQRLFHRRAPFRRASDELPPLSRNSDSSSSTTRSVPLSTPVDRLNSSNSDNPQQDEPLRKRFGLLPSMRRKAAGSDSELQPYSTQAEKRFMAESRKHQIAEERRHKHWGRSKAQGC